MSDATRRVLVVAASVGVPVSLQALLTILVMNSPARFSRVGFVIDAISLIFGFIFLASEWRRHVWLVAICYFPLMGLMLLLFQLS
jgi:hypothetical protein